MQYDLDEDVIFIKDAMSKIPDHSRVTEFIPGPGIHKLKLKFDIKKLRNCFKKLKLENKTQNKKNDYGFGVFSLTQRPGQKKWTENNRKGSLLLVIASACVFLSSIVQLILPTKRVGPG